MSAAPASADRWLRRASARASGAAVLTAGALTLAVPWGLQAGLVACARRAARAHAAAAAALDDLRQELAEREALGVVVESGLTRAQRDAARLSRERRALFEGGLAVSEERRLLEKLEEIITTRLSVDAAGDRVEVRRGAQIRESWPLSGARPRAVGGEARPLPRTTTIVSKERYAHTERGQAALTAGRLEWVPPQVGTSSRARALGEYVLFTREGLAIHGPPLDRVEHEAYPHLCLSLPAPTARHLYERSFVGTRVELVGGGAAPLDGAQRIR